MTANGGLTIASWHLQVWDYASDGYVHRLVQSKTDGKLVEVPSPAQAACGEHLSMACPEYVVHCTS